MIKRHIYLFKPEFCDDVQSGKKTQTIRLPRKRKPRPGDLISLRKWEGTPYKSKQVRLAIGQALNLSKIEILACPAVVNGRRADVYINGNHQSDMQLGDLAKLDGFDCTSDMIDFFADGYGLPFVGELLKWKFMTSDLKETNG